MKSRKNKKVLGGVSFITTVFNEQDSICGFLESLLCQDVLPSEIVVVDGGSTDRTFEAAAGFFKEKAKDMDLTIESILSGNIKHVSKTGPGKKTSAIKVKLIKKAGANIPAGRNTAIENSSGEVICVSDAGCLLDENWVEQISGYHREDPADIIGGMNYPLCKNFLQKCLAACIMPAAGEVDPENYMPSSRNLSFKRKAWAEAGGYPEYMDHGEDMKFNFKLRDKGNIIRFNPGAIVHWEMREGFVQIFKQFFRYAKGDAVGRMYPFRHLIRFASILIFSAIIFAALYFNLWILAVLIPLFAIYVFKSYRRLAGSRREAESCRFHGFGRISSIIFIPLLLIYIDLAKICGYIFGLSKRIIIN